MEQMGKRDFTMQLEASVTSFQSAQPQHTRAKIIKKQTKEQTTTTKDKRYFLNWAYLTRSQRGRVARFKVLSVRQLELFHGSLEFISLGHTRDKAN